MVELQAILKYQEIDKKLYALERELAGCEERKEYLKTKKFLETAADKLDAFDAKAAQLKSAAVELTKKYLKTEDTLKDFAHLDELVAGGADIAFYKKSAMSIADQMKKIKADLAALTASINSTHEEYQKLKKQVIATQKQYKEAYEKYSAVKASKEGDRKAIEAELTAATAGISPAVMEKYKIKRKERIFPVVGKLKDNRCPFCGMEPPLAARSKLTGGNVIECDNCHRIITAIEREASGVKPFAEPTGRSFQTNCEERYRRGKNKFPTKIYFSALRRRKAHIMKCAKSNRGNQFESNRGQRSDSETNFGNEIMRGGQGGRLRPRRGGGDERPFGRRGHVCRSSDRRGDLYPHGGVRERNSRSDAADGQRDGAVYRG